MRAKRRHRNADYVIATSVLLLIIIGLVALASASSDLGKLEYNNPYHYLQRQVIYGLGFGLIGFALGYFINYKKYKKISPVLLILGIGALVLTFTPLGASSGGAARWIAIGPVTFQPSEALKLFLIMYLAAWLSGTRSDRQKSLSEGLVPFLSILGTIAGLLILQRSTSAMVILMASALAVYYVGGAKREHVIASIGIGLLLVAGVILATPYRLERVKTFIHPTEETQGSAYQVNQALVTIGSGGAFGVGYGQSSIKTSLPERIGDSIFAVIAEEFGFVGSMFLISHAMMRTGAVGFLGEKIISLSFNNRHIIW